MQLNLRLLRIFFEVIRQNGFSRAAEKLFISQPAVSKAVRELERLLSLPLIERPAGGARGVRMTDAGAALFEHARSIFALERAALDDVQARTARTRGRLTLGVSTTIAGYRLAPYLAVLLGDAPEIELQVQVGNTAAIERALIDCEIDAGLVEGPVHDQRIEAVHWRDDPMCVVAAASADATLGAKPGAAEPPPADVTALGRQTWLMREAGSGTREVAEAFLDARGIVPARIIEIGSNESIARSVAAGLGIALLPDCVVRELLAIGSVRTVPVGPGGAPIASRASLPVPEAPLARALYRIRLRARPLCPLVERWHEVLAQAD